MSTTHPSPATMIALVTDGQNHRFSVHQIPAMLRLLRDRAAGKMVVVHERCYTTADEASSPARGWDLNPGEASFEQFKSELQVVGTDTRVAGDGHGSEICWQPIKVTAETMYCIRGQMIEIGPLGQSPGMDVEIMFVDVSASTPANPAV
jgi:hypothetical protein